MSCIEVASRHVSVRKYVDEAVPEDHVKAIVEAARRAPSSWGLQPVTVTVVRDPGVKARIAELVGGQEHVAKAPLFIVFSVDLAKLLRAASAMGVETAQPGFGHFAMALLDVGIASGWAALAAEQLGYGITFIAVYAAACEVAEALSMPSHVVPVVGLTVGKPAERPPLQPRHPPEAFAQAERYGDAEAAAKAILGDDQLRRKYERVFPIVLRPGGFAETVGRKLAECLRKRGFTF